MSGLDPWALLLARKANYALEQAFYSSEAVYDLDLKEIFYKDWLFALPACEIPKPGNFVTLQVGAYPLIVVRGTDGLIRAFHNSCRHRGSRLCKTERGSAPKLVCPYHQWTYELDGRLLFAREMGAGFDPGAHPLKQAHCRSVGGLVFLCLAETAPPFEAFAETAARYLAPHDLENAKVAHQTTIVEKGNWKLVIENNRECYHCSGNHPALCRTFSDRPVITTPGANDDEVARHWERCEAGGLPSRFVLHPTSQWRFARIPLQNQAESFTMDGRYASRKHLGGIALAAPGSLLFFHYPNSWNHFLADHAVVFRVLPLSPTETQLTTKWLVRKDAVEGVDYDLKRLTEVWEATNDEDRRVVEDNQIGVNSPAYEPGPYSPLHEEGVIQFVEWYCRALGERIQVLPSVAAE